MFRGRNWTAVFSCAALFLFWTGYLCAQMSSRSIKADNHAGKVIWEEDFSDRSFPHWYLGYYTPTGKEGKPLMEVKDGNLIFTSDFPEPRDNRGYASANYRFGCSQGEGFELARAPVLEMRLRPLQDFGPGGEIDLGLILNFETYGGENGWSIFQVLRDTRGGDRNVAVKAEEWGEVSYNLYDHPALTGAGGRKLLTGITFQMYSQRDPGKSVSLEVDWIRLREMTAEEYARIGPYVEMVEDFKMTPRPAPGSFFGLGIYDLCIPRLGGGLDVALDHMARNWINFIGPVGPRFSDNVWAHYRVHHAAKGEEICGEEDTRAAYFVKSLRREAAKFRQYGISCVADLTGFAGLDSGSPKLEDRDPEMMDKWAKELAEGLKGEDNVLGYYCLDEVKPQYLKNYVVTKSLVEKYDPLRVCTVGLNDFGFLKASFEPWSQIIYTDPYRVGRPIHDGPWDVLNWMTDISKLSGDKPHWVILQAFRTPQVPWHSAASDVEVELMSWLAVSGGANVVSYFLYSDSPWWRNYYLFGQKEQVGELFWCMVDAYGNELDYFEAYKRFTNKIGPLAPLLGTAKLIENPSLGAVCPEIQLDGLLEWAGKKIKAIHVGLLRLKDLDGYILIPVNMDRNNPQALKLFFPDGTKQYSLYDLVSLKEVAGQCVGTISLAELQPGGGHVYLACKAADFDKVKGLVISRKAEQAILVASLDLRMARAWSLKVDDFEKTLADVKQMLDSGQGQEALNNAGQLSEAINSRLASDELFADCRRGLKKTQKELGQIQTMLNVACCTYYNPKDTPAMETLARDVDSISKEFDSCMKDFYFGQKPGLQDRVVSLDRSVTLMVTRCSKETAVEPDYWPYPTQPWKSK